MFSIMNESSITNDMEQFSRAHRIAPQLFSEQRNSILPFPL